MSATAVLQGGWLSSAYALDCGLDKVLATASEDRGLRGRPRTREQVREGGRHKRAALSEGARQSVRPFGWARGVPPRHVILSRRWPKRRGADARVCLVVFSIEAGLYLGSCDGQLLTYRQIGCPFCLPGMCTQLRGIFFSFFGTQNNFTMNRLHWFTFLYSFLFHIAGSHARKLTGDVEIIFTFSGWRVES